MKNRGGESDDHRRLSTTGRRTFVRTTSLSAAALVSGVGLPAAQEASAEDRKFAANPFSLGVASGDPLPDGVVLWTRVAPDPLAHDGHGGMPKRSFPVRWEVAEDEHFRHVVQRGVERAHPALAHSVHVEVHGLRPARGYYYRFRVGRTISPVGRTRTAPRPDAHVTSLTFAAASCQAWWEGYYTAYEHMAAEDLDFVLHLGDYIYEYGFTRSSNVRDVALPDQFEKETLTLAQYRNRFALYHTDPHLQAAHAAFPWILTWDDHDVENNWADDISAHPDLPPTDFLRRRAAAFRAYYEHLPLRRFSRPTGPDARLYRRFSFGDLAQINVLDTRQYRDDQACGDGLRIGCTERLDPARTITGDEQERWLLAGLDRSSATWNVIAEQVFLAQLDQTAGPDQGFGMDMWDGYPASRDRILSHIQDRQITNPVVLSADVHRNLAANLKADFDDPDSATIGVELGTTSISSGRDGADMDPLGKVLLEENPHLKFNNVQRGYVRHSVTPDAWKTDYKVLPYVSQPGSSVYTRVSFAVDEGKPGLQKTASSGPRGTKHGPTAALGDVAEPPDRQ